MSAMSFFFPGLLLGIIGPDLFVVNRCSHLPKTIPANCIRDLQEYIIAGRDLKGHLFPDHHFQTSQLCTLGGRMTS